MRVKLIAEFVEYWEKAFCPNCKAENWIYQSHSARAYPTIYDQCQCHECKRKFWMVSEDEAQMRQGIENCDMGRPNPCP